jgi:PIN domain nuclease of toxin-antitoxin system
MAALVFDAGALIAIERGDRQVGALLAAAAMSGVDAVTSSACVAQAWRDPARQARLTRALPGFLERPFDADAARACGALLGRNASSDIVDGAVALLARRGDTVLTSDPQDIQQLLNSAGSPARVRAI